MNQVKNKSKSDQHKTLFFFSFLFMFFFYLNCTIVSVFSLLDISWWLLLLLEAVAAESILNVHEYFTH